MKVLIACEESQRVCIEFRKLGHIAFSCDIQECSGGHPEWHIKQDVIPLINGNCEFKTMDEKLHKITGEWDLIIGHPPCTYMSVAGARWMFPKAGQLDNDRFKKAMAAKEFFMKIYNAKCKRICVENPRPLLIVGLPKQSQIVQPYEFGHPYSKATCLWLKGLPKLKHTKIIDKYIPYLPSSTGRLARGLKGSRGVVHNSKDASKTFYGIANAMANQWGGKCEK